MSPSLQTQIRQYINPDPLKHTETVFLLLCEICGPNAALLSWQLTRARRLVTGLGVAALPIALRAAVGRRRVGAGANPGLRPRAARHAAVVKQAPRTPVPVHRVRTCRAPREAYGRTDADDFLCSKRQGVAVFLATKEQDSVCEYVFNQSINRPNRQTHLDTIWHTSGPWSNESVEQTPRKLHGKFLLESNLPVELRTSFVNTRFGIYISFFL